MADATNVGAVNIELGIESKIEEQLNKILGSVESAVKTRLEKPLNSIGDAVSHAVKSAASGMEAALEKPIKNTKAKIDAVTKEISDISGKDVSLDASPAEKALDSVTKKAKQTSDEIDAMIEATLNRCTKAQEYLTPHAMPTSVPVAVPRRVKPVAVPTATATPALDAATEQKISEVPPMFHAATDAAGLLEQKLANISAQIGEQEIKLSSLLVKYRDIADEKGGGSDEAGAIDSQITAVQAKLINLQQASMQTEDKLERMMSAATLSAGGCSDAFKLACDSVGLMQQKLSNTHEAISAQQKKLSELKAQYASAPDVSGAEAAAGKTERSFSKASAGVSFSGKKMSSGFSAGLSVLGTAAGKVATKIKQSFAAAGSAISKKFNKLAQGIRGVFKAVFITSVLYAGFRALKEAISSAATQNEQFAKSLNTLKGNLAVAFNPIITAALPILNRLMSALATASQYVATFTSAIFGKTYEQSLAATKQLKAVQKEAKKTQSLAGFDKLNVMGSTDTASSSDDKATDYGALSGNAGIQSKVDATVAKLKALSFSDAGAELGAKLNTAIQKATDYISWDNLGGRITSGIANIADFTNSFFNTTDWFSAGNLAAQLINTFTNSIGQFIDKINWKAMGKGLGDSTNGLFQNVDWKKSGKTVAKGIDAVITYLRTAITTVDWKNIGKSAADWVNGVLDIDWGNLGAGLSSAVRGAFSLVTSAIQTLDWAGLPKKVLDLIKGIDWLGLVEDAYDLIISAYVAIFKFEAGYAKELWSTVKDLGSAIMDAFAEGISISDIISGAANWVKDHIFKPFTDAFKDIFGIHSPSTVFEDFGGYMMQGLAGGITGAITKVTSACETILTKIKEKFVSIPQWFRDKFSEAYQAIKDVFSSGGEIFDGIKSGVAETFKGIVNHLIDGVNAVISQPFREIDSALGKIKDTSILGMKPFDFLPTIPIPEIPKLAAGGIATAPTLAMIGDNPHAATDPEVVSPLSKLKGMMDGGDPETVREIISILVKIYELLRVIASGVNSANDIGRLMDSIGAYEAKMRLRTNGGV